MYSVIIIVILIFGYQLCKSGGLLDRIKRTREYNKDIKQKIENGETKYRWYRQIGYKDGPYTKDDYIKYSGLGDFIFYNIVFDFIGLLLIFFISMIIMVCLSTKPKVETSYYFSINSLKDNLVVEGQRYGFHGYVDGELSYFFSRTYSDGEKIGHIPASKTYIDYDDNERPKITVYQESCKVNDFLSKFTFVDLFNEPQTVKYVITAPDGTIETTGTYSIDME